MGPIESVNCHWAWAGVNAVRVEARNEFGNLIVEDTEGRYWRICPEELAAQIVAANRADLTELLRSPDFVEDWHMTSIVAAASEHLGEIQTDTAFYLVIPAVFGGSYGVRNIKRISLEQLLCLSGEMGRQIQALPDGTQVQIALE